MRYLFLLYFFVCFAGYVEGQAIVIDNTRFITGNKCCTQIQYAIPTNDGGLFFVGSMNNNPGGIIPYFPDTSGRDNVLLGKADNNKQISWIKVFGGSEPDNGMAACQVPDGGYAVLSTVSSFDIDITDHKGANDMWLLRLDADGNVMWKKSYGSSYSDVALSIDNTPDGGFILLGNTNGLDGDVPFHYGGYFELDWLVIKTDGAGNVQWSRNLGSTRDEYIGGAILAVDDAYYLIGASAGTDHDCTDTAWHTGVATPYDCYILKIDNSGNVLWNRSYGGSRGEAPFHAFYDTRDSTIMIAGISNSSDYMVTANYGDDDMWVLKVDKSGNLVWQKTIGTVTQEECRGICAGPGNSYLVYGNTDYGNIGNKDAWVTVLDNSGTIITDKRFGGVARELPRSIVPFSGGYAVTGLSASPAFTEGVTYGRDASYTNAFISFLEYWQVSVNRVKDDTNLMELIPNPTNGMVRITVPENSLGNLKILNNAGRKIYSKKHKGKNDIELDTDNWPAGIYMVQWEGEDGKVYSARLERK